MDCKRCGTAFETHDYFWCHQVCPSCLQPHFIEKDGRVTTYGFFDHTTQIKLRAQIAADGGRYIPRFK